MDSPYLPLFPALSQEKGNGLAWRALVNPVVLLLSSGELGTHSVSLFIPAG